MLDEKGDRKSTRLNSSHVKISYAVFCLKKKKKIDVLARHNKQQQQPRAVTKSLSKSLSSSRLSQNIGYCIAQMSSIVTLFFFFNDTATTEIYTLSLHDALPISWPVRARTASLPWRITHLILAILRSEEHTSELQSRENLVCRLLLEKKKIIPMLCVTIFVILVVWFLLPRFARLMIHTPTAISIFVCLSMVQLMAVFISMRCTLCGHFLQVALTLILVVGYAIAAS